MADQAAARSTRRSPAPTQEPTCCRSKIPVRVAGSAGSSGPKHNGLSVEDYLDIQQLVTTYPMALDTGAGEGYVFADLFTPDGVFMADTVKHQGREDAEEVCLAASPRSGAALRA